jgi:diguanylate cyclase (GGDEF)-like protein
MDGQSGPQRLTAAVARSDRAADRRRSHVVAIGLTLGAITFLINRVLPAHTAFEEAVNVPGAVLAVVFAALLYVPAAAKAARIGIALELLAYAAGKTSHILLVSPDTSRFSFEAATFVPWGAVLVWAGWGLFGRRRALHLYIAGYYAAVLVPGVWALAYRPALATAAVLTVGANFVLAGLVGTVLVWLMIDMETEHAAAEAESQLAQEMALMDVLTGVPNRRALQHDLEREAARGNRTGRLPSLIMFDIDQLKSINDRQGHEAGDRVLAAVGSALRRCVRATDTAGRWGGDEFLVVCADTELSEAVALAERIRRGIIAEAGVTGSFGVARYRPGEAVDATVARADRALYDVKAGGGDRTEAAAV